MGTYFTTTTKTSSTSHSLNNRRQNAEGSRSHQAHEAQHRAGRHRREEGGVPRRVHQAAVGLHQEAQPAGPREQAVPHPRQEDGKGVRRRPHPRLRHGQVPLRAPLLISLSSFPKNQMKEILPDPTSVFPCVQTIYNIHARSDQQLTLPSHHRTPSFLEMPSPRTGVDDGAFFKAARRTAIETGLFSGRRLWRSPTSSKCRPPSKYYQD